MTTIIKITNVFRADLHDPSNQGVSLASLLIQGELESGKHIIMGTTHLRIEKVETSLPPNHYNLIITAAELDKYPDLKLHSWFRQELRVL